MSMKELRRAKGPDAPGWKAWKLSNGQHRNVGKATNHAKQKREHWYLKDLMADVMREALTRRFRDEVIPEE